MNNLGQNEITLWESYHSGFGCENTIMFCVGFFFLRLFIYLAERGQKHQCVVASRVPGTGDLACNPGMCPDWESNFGSKAGTQFTEPHQPGLYWFLVTEFLPVTIYLSFHI